MQKRVYPDATTLHMQSRVQDRLKAIALMVLAVTLFSCLDTTAKYLTTRLDVPVAEVSWVRFLGQFLPVLIFAPMLGMSSRRRLFVTTRLPQQLLRSVFMMATTVLNFLALEHLRLDQTVTIVFLTPLVVALLAGPILGEWVGWRRLMAVLVGFAGILIVVRPGYAEVHPAVWFSVGSMLTYAALMLVTRAIAWHDPPLVTLFYSTFAGVICGAPLALADWAWPSGGLTWLLLASTGLIGGAGHYLLVLAYRLAPASVIAPFLYLQLLAMTALGFLVFGDKPDVYTLIGSAVVIGSGVYLFHRERVTREHS